MKLVVGLGNPGEEYENTRHNVGFMVVEELVGGKRFARSKGAPLTYAWTDVGEEKVEVIKPQTYMNKSGEAVAGLFRKHKEITNNDLYVVHDDLDIVLGDWKIAFGKGPKDHRGLQSIEETLKTKDFWRVRIGVDNRDPDNRAAGEEYVLRKLTKVESEIMRRLIKEVADAIQKHIRDSIK